MESGVGVFRGVTPRSEGLDCKKSGTGLKVQGVFARRMSALPFLDPKYYY